MDLLRQKESEAGFSLLEMLVVLAIASVLFAITFWSLTFQQLTTQKQASMANIYDNQRFAVDTLTRYTRMAGYDVNQPKSFYHNQASGSQPFVEHANGTIRGTDQLTIRYAEEDANCPSLRIKGCNSTVAPFYEKPCPVIGDKVLGIDGTVDSCWGLKCNFSGGVCSTPFEALIVDPLGDNSSILTITDAQTNAVFVKHSVDLCPLVTDCFYPPGSMIVPINWTHIRFRLDYNLNTDLGTACYTPVAGHPRLVMIENPTSPDPPLCDTSTAGTYRKIIPLATDVEDFQIACAIDKTGDGFIDDLDGSNGVSESDYVSNVAVVDQRYIRAVRLSMSFRSSDWVPKAGVGFPPAIEDHSPSGGNADGYMRKTISTRIKIRNMAQTYRD